MVHAFYPSTDEAEAGISLNLGSTNWTQWFIKDGEREEEGEEEETEEREEETEEKGKNMKLNEGCCLKVSRKMFKKEKKRCDLDTLYCMKLPEN